MKKALLALVFLISTVALKAQEIAWMSMDQALLAQQQTPKKNIYGCLHHLVWPL
jgi:hypothetical protein